MKSNEIFTDFVKEFILGITVSDEKINLTCHKMKKYILHIGQRI